MQCGICRKRKHYAWKYVDGQWVCGEHFTPTRSLGVQGKKRADIRSRRLSPDGKVGRFKDGKRIG